MASNRKSEFVSRSSLFASPGQCAVPKKKVARGGNLPVFALHDNSEVMEMSRAAAAAAPIPKQSALILPEDDVEPMDVDATLMPSPQKASDKEEVDEEREVASGNTACTKMATPRRKSMPTPGKRLCFTSKEVSDEQNPVADETTQLEFLMANNPEEVPETVKALIDDNKTMATYSSKIRKEIDDWNALKSNREKLLKRAQELSKESYISSSLPTNRVLLDLSVGKKEGIEDITMRLVDNFLKNTEDAAEIELKKEKLKQLEDAEKINENLIEQMLQLEMVAKRKKEHDAKMRAAYQKELEALKELNRKCEKTEELMSKFQSFKFVF